VTTPENMNETRTIAGIPSRERPPWTTTKRRVRVQILVDDEDPTLRTLVTRIDLARGEHEPAVEFEGRVLKALQEFPPV